MKFPLALFIFSGKFTSCGLICAKLMLGGKLLCGMCCSRGGFGADGGKKRLALPSLAEGIGLSVKGTLGGINLFPLMLLLLLPELNGKAEPSKLGILGRSGLRSGRKLEFGRLILLLNSILLFCEKN